MDRSKSDTTDRLSGRKTEGSGLPKAKAQTSANIFEKQMNSNGGLGGLEGGNSTTAAGAATSGLAAADMGMGVAGGFWSGRLVIIGDSGSGKSVLTKQLVSGLCEKQLKDRMLGGMLGSKHKSKLGKGKNSLLKA